MIENFDMTEINKFVAVLDEHCANGGKADCNKCPFNSILCGAIKGDKLRDFAKFLHDWVEDKNTKRLVTDQITYLEALKTLGLRYILLKTQTMEYLHT